MNVGMFRYLTHEMSDIALEMMAAHALGLNADSVLIVSSMHRSFNYIA